MILSTILLRLKNTNLFSSSFTATNEYELRNERISTRLFIVIMLVLTFAIFIYTAQLQITEKIEVKNPSYDRFQSLSIRYGQTLRCPCGNVGIPYQYFINLKPQFHELCSSDFITQQWINQIGLVAGIYVSDDFSYTGRLIFLALASFCRSANEAVTNALETFKLSRFITSQALIEHEFADQVNTDLQNFQSSTEFTYHQSYDLIQYATQANLFLSGLFSNTVLSVDTETYFVSSVSRFYANNTCNCDTTPTCIDPLTIKDRRINENNSSSYFIIPGLFKGCFLVEAIRQSSFECFYNESCIKSIGDFLQIRLNLGNRSVLPLNSSILHRFNVSSTLDQILLKVMIEYWHQNVSHARYYQQCQVSSCTYLVTSRFNLIYIITTLVAFIGGLTKVLRLIIPRAVKFIRRRLTPTPTITNEIVHQSLLKRLWNFNCFSKPLATSNPIEIKQQLIETRLFVGLLFLFFIILISYYSLERITSLHRIESPTFEQFIYFERNQRSNPSFSCPCSTLVTTYKDFIQIDYDLHPLCSSDFVQLQNLRNPLINQFLPTDLRARAPAFFHSLTAICQVSNDYVKKSLVSFKTSSILINKALSPETFNIQVNTIKETFTSSTSRSFARNLAIILNMTWSNGIMGGRRTNFLFDVESIHPFVTVQYYPIGYRKPRPSNQFCICTFSKNCFSEMSIIFFNSTIYMEIFSAAGLYFGCLQTESIRYSTLTCLLNQSCVDTIAYWLNITNLKAIDVQNLDDFSINSTLGDIENAMFVNRWNVSGSHRALYDKCQPSSCTYTLVQNNSLWFIITAVFGLIGGLMKILKVIIPHFVQSVYSLKSSCCRQERREGSSTNTATTFSFRLIFHRLRQLNLFSSDDPTADSEREIKDQILATRIFLILLIVSLVILTIYSSQVEVTKTVTIKNPSVEQYSSLYQIHSQTVICPCTNVVIPRQKFLILQPTFHQVCQSDFLNEKWRGGLFYTAFYIDILPNDFRLIGSSIFGTLLSLCQLSFTTINDGLIDFDRSSFPSVKVIPKDELVLQGKSLIDLFISTSENAFVNSMSLVRDTTHANSLISGFDTSTSIELHPGNDEFYKVALLPRHYNLTTFCTCYDDPTCVVPAGIYDFTRNGMLLYSIPNMYIGCYMVEATLKSNLAFLYNQSEIDEFRQLIQFNEFSPIEFNTTALNASIPSQYNVTTPIYVMMQKMMTESWYTYVNYTAYYEQCHPDECKYTYYVKFDIIFIITTITGLIGGLVTIYQLIIPYAIKFMQKYVLKRCFRTTTQIIPEVLPENNQ